MAATITRYTPAPTWQFTDVSYCKDIMTSLGIPTSAIVYETTTEAVYKITNGTGTYADTYLRFFLSNATFTGTNAATTWFIQNGTGFESNALTGAGTAYPIAVKNAATNASTLSNFFTTVVSADGSWRQLMTFSDSYAYNGGFAIVRPTNTTLTANDAPLTYAATAQGTSAFGLLYLRSNTTAQYGNNTQGSYVGLYDFGYNQFRIPSIYSLTVGKAGTYGVLPNAPILSGGWPIGYNSNLAFVSNAFLPMDRVIVTAGSEEYTVIDQSSGLAIREV